MNNQFRSILLLITIICINFVSSLNIDDVNDFYTLHARDSRGNIISLSKYSGKVSLVTNVASECGYTEMHYEAYVKIQTIFNKRRNIFNVLAFPCNQFGQQEPYSTSQIFEWAKQNYKINFPLFDKVDVIGKDAALAWQFLTKKSGEEPKWNFWKYLISPTGQVIQAWGPRASLQKVFQVVKEHVEALNGEEIKDEL